MLAASSAVDAQDIQDIVAISVDSEGCLAVGPGFNELASSPLGKQQSETFFEILERNKAIQPKGDPHLPSTSNLPNTLSPPILPVSPLFHTSFER